MEKAVGHTPPLAAGPAKVTGREDIGKSEVPLRESRKQAESEFSSD